VRNTQTHQRNLRPPTPEAKGPSRSQRAAGPIPVRSKSMATSTGSDGNGASVRLEFQGCAFSDGDAAACVALPRAAPHCPLRNVTSLAVDLIYKGGVSRHVGAA
jgi:hypothetical protein